jgi:glycopeptide antibiotics resistance protein
MTYVDDRKPARSRLRVGLATVLFVIYLAFVMWVTMSPSLDGIGVDSVADRVLGVLHRIGIPDAFGYMQLEFTANIGMFIPLGFLLGLALPGWGWWLALILLPAYSYGIEWFQGEFLGDRVSDVRDIISNSIGAWIGTLAAAFLRALVHSRDDKVIARAIWEEQRESRVLRRRRPRLCPRSTSGPRLVRRRPPPLLRPTPWIPRRRCSRRAPMAAPSARTTRTPRRSSTAWAGAATAPPRRRHRSSRANSSPSRRLCRDRPSGDAGIAPASARVGAHHPRGGAIPPLPDRSSILRRVIRD